MLSPSDLVHPKRISGYRYVVRCGGGAGWQGSRNGGRRPHGWRGPMRSTPLEAAQDYCDYANGNLGVAPLVTYPIPKIDMGNTTVHAPKIDKVTVKRQEFKGAHDLYDVLLITANGEVICRKVGITARGHARYADVCRTFGISIKPHMKAVTYKTKAKALEAESVRVAEVCADKAWRRIGKESFAPRKK